MKSIVWYRRDLRVHDQPALAAAWAECDEVIPLFIFDEPLLQSKQFGSACVNFMLSALDDLARSLAALGLSLQWRRGEPVEELTRAARELRIDVIYWNRDYEPAARVRDEAVTHSLLQQGIQVRTFKDHVVFEPGEIRSAAGTPLQRYGAYRKRWWARWREASPVVIPAPRRQAGSRAIARPITFPSPEELGYETLSLAFPAGETNAHRRLKRFLKGPIKDYGTMRNRPAVDGTSRLSPHFRFGTVSTRSAVHAALAALARYGQAWRTGVHTWVDELIWRDFFQHILAAFPQVATGPFRSTPVPPHRTDAQLFDAWRQGLTGFPLVDAGMRQLNQTGWMHNRVRMVVASFLVKDLCLDWRLGERYFMEHLVDADLAANNGNWQWCASTGTDAMPGYRIFNPALQAKKFDPDGDYIRRYVPELARLPVKLIHQPDLMTVEEQTRYACRIGQDYPFPIMDHEQARTRYLMQIKG